MSILEILGSRGRRAIVFPSGSAVVFDQGPEFAQQAETVFYGGGGRVSRKGKSWILRAAGKSILRITSQGSTSEFQAAYREGG